MEPKRTGKKTKRKRVESDAKVCCGIPENTFPSTSALDMLAEYASQCLFADALMSESCVESDIRLREKEQNLLSQAAEKGNGESAIQDKGCNYNSVVAGAELFAKDSVLEVVKMNMEQCIDEKSSNPKETSNSVKNGSLVKNRDVEQKVHDLSNKFRCIKTYSRKKLNKVHCIKEPPTQDHHNDDSHEVSDGPLTDGLMERETEHSTRQNKVEAVEMELITKNSSEQRSKTTSSAVDIPVTPLEETNAREVDHAEVTRNDMCCQDNVSDLSLVTVNGGNSKISHCSVERPIISNSKNKLLILDVNVLLANCVSDLPNRYYQRELYCWKGCYQREPDFWVRSKKVYKRPFCDDFLQFCFDRFHVGIWSSRAKCDVDDIIKFLSRESASRLLFCWNQSHCTTTKFTTVENIDKPLVLKELRKLWEKLEPGLPWEKGEFHESNTLLLDESPDTALVNPMHTAIFPFSDRHYHTKNWSLGPKGNLREYLERLAKADNVQEFVSLNEFGQRPIRPANPSWAYYLKVIESVKCRENDMPSAPDDSHEVSEGPLTDGLMEIETEYSTDHNKVEAVEMEFIAENSSEQRSKTTSSALDIPVTPLEETNAREVDHAEVTRNDMCCPDNVSDLSLVTVNGGNSKISHCSVERPIISNSKNKLLILDVNVLLANCVSDLPNRYYQRELDCWKGCYQREPDFWVRSKKVYKRPFCDDFLQFCFDRFHVGIWSSRAKCDVDDIIKFLLRESASRLLFCWNQSHCTTTKFTTVENIDKPLVLKELRKLWEKLEPGLPWEKGEFHESNTLLLDESPDTALVNPMHTAIFPFSYRHYHTEDSSLGPKGNLREYLERLAKADNVQEFVSLNEFGQRPIRPANPSWVYYLKVLESVKCRENDMPSALDDSHEVSEGPLTDGLMETETEHSTDHNKVEAEEMELIAENSSEQRSTTTSFLVDIPVIPLEETVKYVNPVCSV